MAPLHPGGHGSRRAPRRALTMTEFPPNGSISWWGGGEESGDRMTVTCFVTVLSAMARFRAGPGTSRLEGPCMVRSSTVLTVGIRPFPVRNRYN